MDPSLVYAKTPAGDEAVRQSTRVVQRNLRMVLLQVDGNLSVGQLVAKIGNQRLVEGALKELEEGGFIEVGVPEQGLRQGRSSSAAAPEVSVISEFSTFGPRSTTPSVTPDSGMATSSFSSFGKPVFPFSTSGAIAEEDPAPAPLKAKPQRPGVRISPTRWFVGGLGLLLVVLVAVLLFYPYGNFRPGLEASLARQLSAPVRIGNVRLELLPQPRLLLTDVVIGAGGDGRVAALAITSPHLLLGAEGRQIQEVEARGVVLSANRLVDLPMFGANAASGNFSIRRLRVTGMTVNLGDLVSPEFVGEISFRPDGSTEKASFRSADGGLRLEAVPSLQGVLLAIESLSWKPEGAPFGLESLQAAGLLQKNRLLLQKVDTTFLGGILKGNWLFDWSAGMVMAGEASLTRLDCRKVTAALAPNLRLEGDLSGTLRMRGSGTGWQDMLGRIEANLDAEVTRGVLTGVDLGELARRGSGAVVRSGATRFDSLQARLDVGHGRVVARAIELDAGLMTASGRATVEADGRVGGAVMVQARSSVSTIRVPAQLTGTLLDMSLVASN